MPKKKIKRPGYIGTDRGYRFACVYEKITVNGVTKRKRHIQPIPADATISQAWAIVEDLAADVARKARQRAENSGTDAPAPVTSSKGFNGRTLTWKQLGDWYQAHYLQPVVFNSERKIIAGCPTWKDSRRKLAFIIGELGPKNLVRDLTLEDLRAFRARRLQAPVIIKKKRRDPVYTNRVLTDKHGDPLWETIKTERAGNSVRLELAVIRILLNKAQQWTRVNPWHKDLTKGLDGKERETIATPTEELALLDQIGDLTNSLNQRRRRHLFLYLTVMFDSGCRSAELRRLLVKDVDFDNNRFMVYSYKGGKRRERLIDLTPRARQALLEACNPADGPGKTPDDYAITYNVVVRQPDGSELIEYRPLASAPKSSWQNAKRLAAWWSNGTVNLAGFRAHDIRHTVVTRLIAAGRPAAEVMKLTGHTQDSTFMRYVNPDDSARAAAAEALANVHATAANVVRFQRSKRTA